MSKDLGGRPTVMTDDVLDKLNQAFSLGCSDREACLFADINPATLYNYQKENPEFLDRKQTLKEKPVLKARSNIVKALQEGDIETAKWLLERKKKDEFSLRSEMTGADGETLVPKTIIVRKYSDTQESEKKVEEKQDVNFEKVV